MDRSEIKKAWDLIPNDTEIVITHGPPLGFGDIGYDEVERKDDFSGCLDLYEAISQRIKPKYHVFGHNHEGYGMTTDGVTKYINAASVNTFRKPANKPIVFDLPAKWPINDYFILK